MRRFLAVALTLVFSFTGLISQETKIVNGYKVHHGERPSVDLSKVTPDLYEPGKMMIKLTAETGKFINDDVIIIKTKDGYVRTGVQAIDEMNTKFKAEQYRPALYGLYKISPASVKLKEKHVAWDFNLWHEITLEDGVDVIEAVKEYQNLEEVQIAEPIYKKRLYSVDPKAAPGWTPNDPGYSDQWHYNNTAQVSGGTVDCDIDLPEAWEIEKGLSDVIVAVIDQGIQFDHPDLAAHMWPGIGPDGTSTNADFHGSHVAGTVAAVNNNGVGVSGIAGGSGSGDGVRLMSIDLFTPQTLSTTLEMFSYAADNGAAISQNSWGYGGPDVYNQVDMDGIDYFNANGGGSVLNGGITIFAAGNDNDDGNWWPGYYSEALSVAATNFNDVRSWYSNYGNWIHIAAPGGETGYTNDPEGVYSTTSFASGTYSWLQGTSMACPHVSGVAALLVSNAYRNGIVLDNTDIWNLLVDNTDYIDDINPTYAGLLGSGRLNALSSLTALQDMLYTAPPSAPTLVSPSNGSTIGDSTPTFDWADNDATSTYTILVDNNSNFSSPEINEVTTESEYTPGSNLAEGTYYWKVLATNNIGSSSYTTSWNTTIAYPDINLSKTQVNTTAAPDATTSDSFDIENTGAFDLTYSASFEYTGWPAAKADIIVEENDFESGLIYTNSGSWSVVSGQARTGTQGISTLTSPVFDGSVASDLFLDFDHANLIRSGGYFQVEWNDGSTWTQVYNGTTTASGSEHIAIPNTAIQVRFIANVTRSQGQTGWQTLDNVVVYGPPAYDWLRLDGGLTTSGTVSASSFDPITVGCDAAGLVEGLYTADITITSDDPDEPTKVLPVEFTVAAGGPITPATPANVLTSISGADLVIDWDIAADATSYDVYSSDDPYGGFALETNVPTNQYVVPYTESKKFYYIVSKNATK